MAEETEVEKIMRHIKNIYYYTKGMEDRFRMNGVLDKFDYSMFFRLIGEMISDG